MKCHYYNEYSIASPFNSCPTSRVWRPLLLNCQACTCIIIKNSYSYKAIVIGATDAVGHSVVNALLASPRCKFVTTLVRRNLEIEYDKLKQNVVDFDKLKQTSQDVVLGHEVSVCMHSRDVIQCMDAFMDLNSKKTPFSFLQLCLSSLRILSNQVL